MSGRTALTMLLSLLLVSACIPVEINVNIAPEKSQTPESEFQIPSPASGREISPTTTPFMPALTPPVFTPPPGESGNQNRAVEAARRHLAGVLDVPVEQITLLQVESVTWRDASLGCPRPGRNYAQVLTPGYRILLEHDGQRYELHSDQSGTSIVTCTAPAISERIPLGRGSSQDEIVQTARENLAQRLAVPLESVTIISVEETEWDDPSLGCGLPPGKQPDRAYPGGIPGLRIVLEAGGQTFEYHSGGLWMVFCGLQGGSLQDPNSR